LLLIGEASGALQPTKNQARDFAAKIRSDLSNGYSTRVHSDKTGSKKKLKLKNLISKRIAGIKGDEEKETRLD
jgi:hypothetical protein